MPVLGIDFNSGSVMGVGWRKISSRLFGRAGEPNFGYSISIHRASS